MDVTLLYFADCPSWQVADEHLQILEGEFNFTLSRVEVTTPEAAQAFAFLGSPSVQVDGVDLLGDPGAPAGLSCRIYQTPGGPAGSPTIDQLRTALSEL